MLRRRPASRLAAASDHFTPQTEIPGGVNSPRVRVGVTEHTCAEHLSPMPYIDCLLDTRRPILARPGRQHVSAQDETRKLLAHIAARMGGVETVAAKLNVSPRVLGLYMTGKEPVPDALVIQVVDLILNEIDKLKNIAPSATQPAARSPDSAKPQ